MSTLNWLLLLLTYLLFLRGFSWGPVSLFFAWYDFWIGWFFDSKKKILYLCFLPGCVIRISDD